MITKNYILAHGDTGERGNNLARTTIPVICDQVCFFKTMFHLFNDKSLVDRLKEMIQLAKSPPPSVLKEEWCIRLAKKCQSIKKKCFWNGFAQALVDSDCFLA